uniref:Medium chain reductase pydE n=1 Tax=Acremonium sp. TaxID=2046025 RepID=PYDE_ACRSP|nr:RecName: Full=Medium chain reductase pydE; AltName: Full=Pyrrocidines biosynthesis cluster protein E [Acremonium sp.]QXF14604.1 PydE [Acremonium sp.]
MSSTMRGWVRQHRGPYESSLKLIDSLPVPPDPGSDSSDIIVRVSYVALEFSIAHIMGIFPALPFAPPLVPEICVSGTVASAGGKAPEELRQPGTQVLAMTDPMSMMLFGTGALKEYMRLPEQYVVPLLQPSHSVTTDHPHGTAERPQALTLAEGAGLISNGSAAQAVVRAANVLSGQRVLVNGASGSVGHIVSQLCRARGAYVVGVASGVNQDFVRRYGCNEFVDYTKHTDLPEYLASTYGSQPFDSILDCVGSQDLYANSPRYLLPGRPLVNIGAFSMTDSLLSTLYQWSMNSWCPTWLGGVPRPYILFSNTPDMQGVLSLVEMVQQGKLKVHIDSEFEMEDLIKAYERVTSKRARGKVLIRIH